MTRPVEWRDTSERDEREDDEPCRAVGCTRTTLWLASPGGYEDPVCLWHLSAYLVEFSLTPYQHAPHRRIVTIHVSVIRPDAPARTLADTL